MSMKFYLTRNATIPVANIQFEGYAIIGGSQFGVYATDNADEIEKLDKLVADGRVFSQTQAEHENCLKKKPKQQKTIRQLPINNDSSGAAIKGAGAKVVSNPNPETIATTTTKAIETTADALSVAQVAAPSIEAKPAPAPTATTAPEVDAKPAKSAKSTTPKQ